MSFARNDARLAFEKQHPQTLATLDRTVEVAGTDLWDVFRTRQPWVNAVVGLYDVDEVESYLDFRCMIGHIVPGLLHCAAGADYLATYVDGNAPRGLLKYAVMGHPDIAKYVGKAAGHVRKLAVDPMLKELQDLLAKFPPDGASQQLSVLMGALVAKGKLKSPQSYWTSAYRPIMEVLDGDMARLHEVPKEELGAWMRERMGGHGVNGFRPRTVERAAGALVEVYDSEEVQAQLDQSTKLSTRLRFWHNAKLGLGGLGLFASAYSANAAFKALGREDGLTFANSLDAGGKVLGLGVGGSAMLKRAYYEKHRDLALSRRYKAAAAAFGKIAESCERSAIGAGAMVALLMGIKDAWTSVTKETGATSGISVASSAVQFTAAGVGGMQLAGKISTKTLESLGIAGRTLIRGGALASRIGSGPIGWTLLALEVLYTTLRTWHDKVAEEQKITDWIARSVWGTGKVGQVVRRQGIAAVFR